MNIEIMMNIQPSCPKTLAEALLRAEALLSDSERDVIQTKSLIEVGWCLHMTLGHKLRNELNLWSDEATGLFDDINQKMPEHLAIDADTASAAVIDALWNSYHGESRK